MYRLRKLFWAFLDTDIPTLIFSYNLPRLLTFSERFPWFIPYPGRYLSSYVAISLSDLEVEYIHE